jgi:hypothetical protein
MFAVKNTCGFKVKISSSKKYKNPFSNIEKGFFLFK